MSHANGAATDTPRIKIDGNTASARFRQHYRAAGINTSSSKTLEFVRVGNRWLIREEIAR